MKSFSVYVHVPFCVKKCAYCDFASGPADVDRIEAYLDALENEIRLTVESWNPEKIYGHNRPETLFIGGGTPSTLDSRQFQRIVDALGAVFDLSSLNEFTVEVNPGTVNPLLLETYRSNGVDRVSMGVQSFDDRILKRLGRIHTASQVMESYSLIRESGIPRVSLDLMLGLPGQTMATLECDVEKAVSMGPDHLSVYSLIIEEGTPLQLSHQLEPLDLPEEDVERIMYWRAVELMASNGYVQYEISNFAKLGEESLHNSVYWHCGDYYGFGLSAHGRIDGIRYGNDETMEGYIGAISQGSLPMVEENRLTEDEFIEEWIMMGLRMNAGLDPTRLEPAQKELFMEKYTERLALAVQEGYIIVDGGRYIPTTKGVDYNNQLLLMLLYED